MSLGRLPIISRYGLIIRIYEDGGLGSQRLESLASKNGFLDPLREVWVWDCKLLGVDEVWGLLGNSHYSGM